MVRNELNGCDCGELHIVLLWIWMIDQRQLQFAFNHSKNTVAEAATLFWKPEEKNKIYSIAFAYESVPLLTSEFEVLPWLWNASSPLALAFSALASSSGGKEMHWQHEDQPDANYCPDEP